MIFYRAIHRRTKKAYSGSYFGKALEGRPSNGVPCVLHVELDHRRRHGEACHSGRTLEITLEGLLTLWFRCYAKLAGIRIS